MLGVLKNRKERSQRAVPASIMMPRLLLLLSVLFLTTLGCVMVYSASIAEAMEAGTSALSYLTDQLGFVAIGLVVAFVLWKFFPCSVWNGPLLWLVWAVSVFLLILTAVAGIVGLGAQRWVSIGPISMQPSEFAKVGLVLMAARIYYDYRNQICTVNLALGQAFVLILLPLGFLFVTQSDLGTTLIIALGILAVMWMGEVPLKVIGGIAVFGIVFVVLATVFSGYRSDRLLFLNPWDDGEGGLGNGFQLIHSFYAFSQGGLFGVGIGNSREKYYLPEAETDFIFSIIGEELGMVGAVGVIALFVVFLYAGMRIARAAIDDFGAMVAGSCTIMIVSQAFINIGCVVGLLPTTGKPLPFVSSGGSSLVASFIMVGLILSVSQESAGSRIHERRRANLRVVRSTESSRSSVSSARGRR